MDGVHEHVDVIREVFQYSLAFSGKTFVIQLDDAIVLEDDSSTLSTFARDLGLLHQAGIRIVLVAGARRRIDEILKRYGVDTERHDGVRISSPDAIPFAKMAAFDSANRIMTSLSGLGINAVIGNWVRARSLGVIDGVDYQDAGVVDKIRVDLLRGVIEQGTIPILPCIGWSASGRPYNISSRELATTLSMTLGASKLFFLAEFAGLSNERYRMPEDLEDTQESRISRLSVDQAAAFLELNCDKARDLGMELVQLAHRAGKAGVERIHIVDGRADGAVLREIFSNLGVGTMIHSNEYQSIRKMDRSDVAVVHRLMRPLVASGLLIERTERDLDESHQDFVVFEIDEMIHGCGALHAFDSDQGEIAGIAVDRSYDQLGIGQRIVRYLIDEASRAGMKQVFVLTTQASDWFQQLGFVPGTLEDIPAAKRERYDHKRKSRILIRRIDS